MVDFYAEMDWEEQLKELSFNDILLLLLQQTFHGFLDFVWDYLVSQYQKGKTKINLDFLEQETMSGSGISWATCKSAPHPCQHPTTQFLHARCPSCRPTNSIKALKALSLNDMWQIIKGSINEAVKKFVPSITLNDRFISQPRKPPWLNKICIERK